MVQKMQVKSLTMLKHRVGYSAEEEEEEEARATMNQIKMWRGPRSSHL